MPEPEKPEKPITNVYGLIAHIISTYGDKILSLVMVVTIYQVMMTPIITQKDLEAERQHLIAEEMQKTADSMKANLAHAETSTRLLDNILSRLAVPNDNK